jgi:hypothetical protein
VVQKEQQSDIEFQLRNIEKDAAPEEGRKPLEAGAAKGRSPRVSNARKVGKL